MSLTGLLETLTPAPGSPCPCRAGEMLCQPMPPPASSLAQACSIPQQALAFSKELQKFSHKPGPLGWQSTWSISRCSTAHGAETRGHAGISELCPWPQQKQHEGQKRCHGVSESQHAAQELWGCRCGAGKAWSRVRERTRSCWVLTSRRSLVLLSGNKERKSHQS